MFCSELYWVTSSSFHYLNSITRLLFPHEITSGLVLPCNWSQYWACKSIITPYAKFSFKSFHADRYLMVCELLLKLWWSFLISLFYHLTSDVEVSSLCSISLFFFFWSCPPFSPSLPPPYSSSFTHLLPPLTFPPPPSPHNFALSAQYCTTDSAYMIFLVYSSSFPSQPIK